LMPFADPKHMAVTLYLGWAYAVANDETIKKATEKNVFMYSFLRVIALISE
jgi:hypothetical protein